MIRRIKVIRKGEIKPNYPVFKVKGFTSTRLINSLKDGSDRFMLSLVRIEPGVKASGIYEDKDEAVYVLNGKLKVILKNGEEIILKKNEVIFIPEKTDKILINDFKETVEAIAVHGPSKTEKELQMFLKEKDGNWNWE